MNCVSPYCAIKLLFQHAIRNDKTYFMFAEVIVVVVCACGKFVSFRAEILVSKASEPSSSISNTLFYEIVDLYSMAFLLLHSRLAVSWCKISNSIRAIFSRFFLQAAFICAADKSHICVCC